MYQKAWKLFRQLKSGKITPLFINKTQRLQFKTWYPAEAHPTPGYKFRPYWHCTDIPVAPHLSEKNRIWLPIVMKGFEKFKRPLNQGGMWYLAHNIMIFEHEIEAFQALELFESEQLKEPSGN